MTDREQLCKEFTLLTGGHWHEWEHKQLDNNHMTIVRDNHGN
jgi:hypothetical protein